MTEIRSGGDLTASSRLLQQMHKAAQDGVVDQTEIAELKKTAEDDTAGLTVDEIELIGSLDKEQAGDEIVSKNIEALKNLKASDPEATSVDFSKLKLNTKGSSFWSKASFGLFGGSTEYSHIIKISDGSIPSSSNPKEVTTMQDRAQTERQNLIKMLGPLEQELKAASPELREHVASMMSSGDKKYTADSPEVANKIKDLQAKIQAYKDDPNGDTFNFSSDVNSLMDTYASKPTAMASPRMSAGYMASLRGTLFNASDSKRLAKSEQQNLESGNVQTLPKSEEINAKLLKGDAEAKEKMQGVVTKASAMIEKLEALKTQDPDAYAKLMNGVKDEDIDVLRGQILDLKEHLASGQPVSQAQINKLNMMWGTLEQLSKSFKYPEKVDNEAKRKELDGQLQFSQSQVDDPNLPKEAKDAAQKSVDELKAQIAALDTNKPAPSKSQELIDAVQTAQQDAFATVKSNYWSVETAVQDRSGMLAELKHAESTLSSLVTHPQLSAAGKEKLKTQLEAVQAARQALEQGKDISFSDPKQAEAFGEVLKSLQAMKPPAPQTTTQTPVVTTPVQTGDAAVTTNGNVTLPDYTLPFGVIRPSLTTGGAFSPGSYTPGLFTGNLNTGSLTGGFNPGSTTLGNFGADLGLGSFSPRTTGLGNYGVDLTSGSFTPRRTSYTSNLFNPSPLGSGSFTSGLGSSAGLTSYSSGYNFGLGSTSLLGGNDFGLGSSSLLGNGYGFSSPSLLGNDYGLGSSYGFGGSSPMLGGFSMGFGGALPTGGGVPSVDAGQSAPASLTDIMLGNIGETLDSAGVKDSDLSPKDKKALDILKNIQAAQDTPPELKFAAEQMIGLIYHPEMKGQSINLPTGRTLTLDDKNIDAMYQILDTYKLAERQNRGDAQLLLQLANRALLAGESPVDIAAQVKDIQANGTIREVHARSVDAQMEAAKNALDNATTNSSITGLASTLGITVKPGESTAVALANFADETKFKEALGDLKQGVEDKIKSKGDEILAEASRIKGSKVTNIQQAIQLLNDAQKTNETAKSLLADYTALVSDGQRLEVAGKYRTTLRGQIDDFKKGEAALDTQIKKAEDAGDTEGAQKLRDQKKVLETTRVALEANGELSPTQLHAWTLAKSLRSTDMLMTAYELGDAKARPANAARTAKLGEFRDRYIQILSDKTKSPAEIGAALDQLRKDIWAAKKQGQLSDPDKTTMDAWKQNFSGRANRPGGTATASNEENDPSYRESLGDNAWANYQLKLGKINIDGDAVITGLMRDPRFREAAQNPEFLRSLPPDVKLKVEAALHQPVTIPQISAAGDGNPPTIMGVPQGVPGMPANTPPGGNVPPTGPGGTVPPTDQGASVPPTGGAPASAPVDGGDAGFMAYFADVENAGTQPLNVMAANDPVMAAVSAQTTSTANESNHIASLPPADRVQALERKADRDIQVANTFHEIDTNNFERVLELATANTNYAESLQQMMAAMSANMDAAAMSGMPNSEKGQVDPGLSAKAKSQIEKADETERSKSLTPMPPISGEEAFAKWLEATLKIIRTWDEATRKLILAQIAKQMMDQVINNLYKKKADESSEYHNQKIGEIQAAGKTRAANIEAGAQLGKAEGAQAVAALSGTGKAGARAEAFNLAELRKLGVEGIRQQMTAKIHEARNGKPPINITSTQEEKILGQLTTLLNAGSTERIFDDRLGVKEMRSDLVAMAPGLPGMKPQP